MAGSAWTNQIVSLIVVSAGTGFTGIFTYSPAPGAGNLIASVAAQAGVDPYGNTYEQGITSYVPIGGVTYAVQLGESSFGGSPVAGLFLHTVSGATAAFEDPNFTGAGTSVGSDALMSSGQSTSGSGISGVQCTDSTGSGIAGGEVDIIGGLVVVQQNLQVDGTLTVGGSSNTGDPVTDATIATTSGNFNGGTLASHNHSFGHTHPF